MCPGVLGKMITAPITSHTNAKVWGQIIALHLILLVAISRTFSCMSRILNVPMGARDNGNCSYHKAYKCKTLGPNCRRSPDPSSGN